MPDSKSIFRKLWSETVSERLLRRKGGEADWIV